MGSQLQRTKTNSLEKLKANPLITKADLQEAFLQLAHPLKPHYSDGHARVKLGVTGVHYGPDIAEMEGFSRVLWGFVPFLAGGGEDDMWELILDGIRNGTDPGHKEYWGEVADYDQRLVEMAAFGYALSMIPERIWTPLNGQERANLYAWLNQMNAHPCYDCNWLFFNVLVNLGFRTAGLPYDGQQLENNLRRIDDFYLSDGWYSDGIGGHIDYYVPFAIHFYGLLYAKLMGDEDPERSRVFKERAGKFAEEFIHWFAGDGSALPYGRSLAYRFAQSAFWGALAFAEVETMPYGVIKGLILRNMRWWLKQDILNEEGVLTIGYAYPNLVMAENYNSPGSPYWSLKFFMPLALVDNHPFWLSEELPLPELKTLAVQQPAHLVICRQPETDHVAAFNSGHLSTNEHTHTSAKYEKFVYSTAFGFSVPRSEWGIAQGAFDSTLALSEAGDNLYRVRRQNIETRIEDNILYSRWKPWANVEVQTWVVAGLPWHIRIHRVQTGRALDAAEGGYAVALEPAFQELRSADGYAVTAVSSHGVSGVLGLAGYREAVMIRPHTNTNVLRPRTAIPTLLAGIAPGTHWLVSAYYGEPCLMSSLGMEEPRNEDGTGADVLARADVSVRDTDPLLLLGIQLTGSEIRMTSHCGRSRVIPLV
ncbi:hypothetical protein A3842_18735 [Paenibacillus sp. P3E]|uniref:DUF2264 domain-containing protein n=1 Tax=Paenibacillus sp. P3E TaxID=1349435 RepID=UPI0009402C6D|nr:DUF2264 domain-containing protein [Paenibacillus sp. P3E]OKP76005.1 hypothetical protein A3842_18735 [Paenibacillus sp. P3E]